LLSNQFHAADDRLAAGDTLVLYTDGAVVRRGRSVGVGVADLTDCVAEVVRGNKFGERNTAAAICAALTGGPNQDDVSVLAATVLTARPEPLTISVRASPESLGEVRGRFSAWLDEFRAGEDDRVALELSVVEAVTNSIEHAFTGPPGEVRVDATLDRAGTVGVTIRDDGRWKPPRADPGFRGRGLMMMREFSDEFQLDISTTGTTVGLAKVLSSPILIDGDPPVSAVRASDGLEFDVRDGPDGVTIALAGTLDSSSVDRLHARLLEIDRKGALPVKIVLDDLTLLTSAGLRALYEHAGRLLAIHRPLRLIARPGSPARHVLAVSGLDQLIDVRP
jgi:anti-sigma regulatory factor (Ser/Thr protein kinase)/anti-anti-sigma regulatory factor